MKYRIAVAALTLALVAPAPAAIAQVAPLSAARIADRVAIEDLLATYLYRLDHGQTEKIAELFASDGVMDVENVGPLKGPAAIGDYYAKRSKTRVTRHVMTNLYIEFVDATHARTTHTLLYFMGEGAGPFPATPGGVADYANMLEKRGGRWVITYRKPTPIFGFRPGAPAPTK
jgi:hypothetical protein